MNSYIFNKYFFIICYNENALSCRNKITKSSIPELGNKVN